MINRTKRNGDGVLFVLSGNNTGYIDSIRIYIIFVGGLSAGQAIQYALSISICVAIKHYVDGMFFGSICTLLSMMMIYKYWDSITKEDLEFSVGGKGNVWEVKDLINVDDEFAPYAGKVNSSTYGYTNEYNTASHPSVVAKPHAPHNSEYY
ncbi:Chitin synthase export chaperone [Zancudomyces culisetae]|uniref:Chitin synthase export chaperone n=1 Tax=Zancudomyces culisetae TaxID=1213189 RepID=A0A1R1PM26_ZANCU|nr:Chitin synthase export chaperone [Zancudomyces culisetae]OMH83001.1 Chitin synthase export chaperone [Zancudomyces culisetae]|eukprot:OMH82015.1 Chitin synthase export chaperone [Zancudomyces culisetae]